MQRMTRLAASASSAVASASTAKRAAASSAAVAAASSVKKRSKVSVAYDTHSADVDAGHQDVSASKKASVATSREPARWRDVHAAIMRMRAARDAPVDTMGCERLGDADADPKVFRFQTLVSLMLSAQTKDQVTAAAVLNLKRDGPLTVERILSMSEAQIDALICKVGFHQRKAKFIRDTARILRDRYDDDIPPTLEGLVELPGVGPKMAFLALQVAWKQNAGIGVDVHVHRISNRLRWVRNTKTPEETRVQLQAWLPSEYWTEINPLLVGFGQQICLPRNPLCSTCLASDLCPSSSHKPRKSLAQAVAEREAAEHDEA